MKVDYIIVGCGLAGIAFCEQLKEHNKTFFVFDNNSQQSSTVAGGLYNPVILNRFTKVWKSREQLDLALPKYQYLEQSINVKLDYKLPIFRLFHYLKEQKTWLKASKKSDLAEFMSLEFTSYINKHIHAPLGYAEVFNTGRIDTKTLIKNYRANLEQEGIFSAEAFNYDGVIHKTHTVTYNNIEAKHIVFAEGYGLKNNPYFNYLPLSGLKGEYITVEVPDLKLHVAVKSTVFIIPLGNDLYRIGATFDREQKDNQPTNAGKKELTEKLGKLINLPFKVVNHTAGVRPTVKDHKPLVGQHTIFKNMYVLNGLGSRGVLIGPYAAKALFAFIEKNIPLDLEIDILRFTH